MCKNSEEEKIREHQKMLALKIQEENLKKYKDGVDTVTKKADTTSPKDIETYKSTSDFPTDMRSVYQVRSIGSSHTHGLSGGVIASLRRNTSC